MRKDPMCNGGRQRRLAALRQASDTGPVIGFLTICVLVAAVLAPATTWAADCSGLKDQPREPLRRPEFDSIKGALDGGANAFPGQYSPLMFAAGDGDAALTRFLLSRGANTEHRDQNKDRPLLWAADRGRLETVRLLLDAGSPPDSAEDPYGITPLMKAARSGHAATACLLINRGADIHRREQTDSTPLHEAVLGRNTSLVNLLLEAGANPRASTTILNKTPLHDAILYGNPEMVGLLVRAGADLEARDHEGKTALWHAASHDLSEPTAILLAAGAEPDARSKSGETAFVAASQRSGAAARLLLERTVALDAGFVAAVWGGHAEFARRLFERGASVNAVGMSGDAALAGAVRHEGLAMLEWFLERKVDLRGRGPAALYTAARAGRTDIAERLLGAGVPVNSRTATGATALFAAAAEGHTDLVWRLLEKGADYRMRDNQRQNIEDYMTSEVASIKALIERHGASRAYRPTHDLEARLHRLTTAHNEVRARIKELAARPCASATPCLP